MFQIRVCILIVGLLVEEPRTQVSGGAEPLTIVRGSAAGKKTPVDLWGEPLAVGALARMHASSFREVRQILGAALSADGTIVALATNQNQLLLFDARTAKLIKRINVEPFGSPSLAFTPDGAKLAWINQGGALILRDISQDKEGSRLAVAKRRIARFSFRLTAKPWQPSRKRSGKNQGSMCGTATPVRKKGRSRCCRIGKCTSPFPRMETLWLPGASKSDRGNAPAINSSAKPFRFKAWLLIGKSADS